MKSATYGLSNQLFGGVFGVIADSLGQTTHFLPSASAGPDDRGTHGAKEPGVMARFGRWLERRQMERVAPEFARAQDVFDRLDQWMWRQHMREVESYLAKSSDVFDLERRLKGLDRGPAAGIF